MKKRNYAERIRSRKELNSESTVPLAEIPAKRETSWIWIIVISSTVILALLTWIYKDRILGDGSNYEKAVLPVTFFSLLSLIVILWVLPKIYVRTLRNKPLGSDQSEFDREKERLKLEDDTRKTIAQILGGMVILGGLFFTYNTYRLNIEQLKLGTKQQEISQEGQITDRFTQAVSQLGSEDTEIRLGGLYSLARLAKDSPQDHWTIMEIISAYVREKSPKHKPRTRVKVFGIKKQNRLVKDEREIIRTDIEAALTIIGSRDARQDPPDSQIDLSNSNLVGIDISSRIFIGEVDFIVPKYNINFERADFSGTDLTKADLRGVNFTDAIFFNTNLRGANLDYTNFDVATLRYADLRGASLSIRDLHFEPLLLAIIDEDTILPDFLKDRRQELIESSQRVLEDREKFETTR